ncbi:MAG TPA: response regulator [Chloroflexi bacterium]|nr:response regulator [Chloroflexota bacterium]
MTKIMLVEDDHTMRSLLKTLLEMEGFEVIFGPGHADALLEALRAAKPALLVMDVHLAGGINGIDLLDSIRQDKELQHTRVVITSGMNYDEAALAAGADGFLQKPYMVDDLLNLIRQTLPKTSH